MQSIRFVAGALSFVLCACATNEEGAGPEEEVPSSGIDPVLAFNQLDATQREQFCQWETAELGGPGYSEQCTECTGDACIDWTVTIFSVPMCLEQLEAFARCGRTVSQVEACVVSQSSNVCHTTAACDALSSCE